jgi:tetratricopeptide (TPR) repeat protein
MLDYSQAKVFLQKAIDLAGSKDTGDIQFSLAEVYEAANEPDKACGIYLKIADTYKDDRKLVNRSLLRCAKIYEDRDDFRAALEVYSRVVQDGSEESGFAGERAGWIRANIK